MPRQNSRAWPAAIRNRLLSAEACAHVRDKAVGIRVAASAHVRESARTLTACTKRLSATGSAAAVSRHLYEKGPVWSRKGRVRSNDERRLSAKENPRIIPRPHWQASSIQPSDAYQWHHLKQKREGFLLRVFNDMQLESITDYFLPPLLLPPPTPPMFAGGVSVAAAALSAFSAFCFSSAARTRSLVRSSTCF